MGDVSELLYEALTAGLTLQIDGERLIVRGPKHLADLARRLLNHKPDVVAILSRRANESSGTISSDACVTAASRPSKVVFPDMPSPSFSASDNADKAVARDSDTAWRCRCGSTEYVNVPIHSGRSVRRDCVQCGRFIDFSVWNGAPRDERNGRPSG